jgi:hypothetical protein
MTCGLHRTLETAVTAVQVALTTAIESGVSDKDLDNLVCAYKGLKSVAKANVTTGIEFVPDTTLGDTLTFNDDIKIDTSAYTDGTVTFGGDYVAGLGSDVITFPDDIDKDV